jgi:calcyphosin
MDDNGDKKLNIEEFVGGIRDTGLDITANEAKEIFNSFDKDGSGTINMTEFLLGIRVKEV